jgi:transcriptional regulator with XRE-family HTH domain
MARIADHPLRLARLQLGLSQVALATRAGVNRAAITAIEDGRTKNPSQRIIDVIATGLGIDEDELVKQIQDYVTKPVTITPPPAVQNLMVIPPYTLSQYYKTFKQWRLEIAKTPTALASMLRVNPAVISRYEAGQLSAFPDILSRKLIEAFKPYGITPEYVVELEKLPAA